MPTPCPARSLALLTMFAIASACGGGGGGTGAADSSSSSSTGVENPDIDPSLSHGFVRLQFARTEGAETDPFAATDTVIATLSYGACLSSFYTSFPSMRQYGEVGAKVFGGIAAGGEGWQDRLCAANTADHVDCSIVWITQQFDETQDLTVTYRVNAPLENGTLLFGPIPTALTAHCQGGTSPTLEADGGATVIGKDGADNDVWHVEAFDPLEAATNQDEPIVVTAVPVE